MNKNIKKLWSLGLILFVSSNFATAQIYLQATVGTAGTYAGNCMVNTSSGTFYDDGGAGGNYSNNINQIYRTFCPAIAGTCVRATFTAFSATGADQLRVRNGAFQSAPVLATLTGTPALTFYQSTSTSGCLTFDFFSNAALVSTGWAATLTNVACAQWVPTPDSDCPSSTVICSGAAFGATSTGPGLLSENCGSCLEGGETYSDWYVWAAQTSGTFGLTITPTTITDDYDFVVYGPGTSCGALGPAFRCSYSATSGVTGLGGGAVDLSEGVGGNSWVAPIVATAGQTFYLQIQHWTPPTTGYTVSWQLSGGASLDCTPPLPVQLQDFKCQSVDDQIGLYWSTATEVNNDYFLIEKSFDGVNYTSVARIDGQGNSNEKHEYIYGDAQPQFGANYYRISQYDFDGNVKMYDPISCEFGSHLPEISEINIFDLNGHQVLTQKTNTNNLESIMSSLVIKPGMYILYTTYVDGTTKFKKFVKM